jgi:hypothetical protein
VLGTAVSPGVSVTTKMILYTHTHTHTHTKQGLQLLDVIVVHFKGLED